MQDVEQRVARLEAAKQIEDLKARYSRFCDEGYDPDGIAGLFVADGTWETTGFGRQEGVQEIHAFMSAVSADIPWAWHSTSNPSVSVAEDGRSATGSWYSLVICQRRQPSGAVVPMLMVGKYADAFVLTEAGWRFSAIDCTLERTAVLRYESFQ
jgi:hypothetical protein